MGTSSFLLVNPPRQLVLPMSKLLAVNVKLEGSVGTQFMADKCAKHMPLINTCIDLELWLDMIKLRWNTDRE
jgi:hypothetical protein